jgi:hypothetical protein
VQDFSVAAQKDGRRVRVGGSAVLVPGHPSGSCSAGVDRLGCLSGIKMWVSNHAHEIELFYLPAYARATTPTNI